MEITVIEKGATFDIEIQSKAKSAFYFGAGWDNPNGPVDLDIVCVRLTGGKLASQSDLVYFGRRNASGIALSEDNQTGEDEGDDESVVIDTRELGDGIDSVVVGLAAYAGADLSTAPNPHFRVCDGDKENSVQFGDVSVSGGAKAGDTVLVAFKLAKGDNGWTLENIGEFHKCGAGGDSIKGFAALYQ